MDCTALVVSLTVIIFTIDFLSKKRGRMPPGPWGVPLVGYLPFLGTEPHQTFAKLGIAYGPIYRLWLGNKMYVVLSSPDVVKEVMREKDIIFANRDAGVAATIVTYGKSDIAFRDYGPEWRKMRKIFVHKMLGNARLDASFELRKDVVEKSVKEVHGMIGEPVKIGCIGLLTVVNSMVAMIWGAAAEDGGSGGIDWEDLMSELMVLVAAPNVSDFFPFLALMDLQGIGGKMRELSDRFERVFEVAIERIGSGKGGGGKESFLQYLLEMQDGEDLASSLTMTQIKAILMDAAVGGTDTTSTVFEWALSELLLHPQAMKQVQDELAEIVGLNSLVDESHLSKLRYLDAVVKETMRLHPAFPLLIPRRPSEDTEIQGYSIPKNTTIFINVWAMHRNPSLWDNPLEFKPQRFLDGTTEWDYSGKDLKYLPFGSGRRICPGLPLAERALLYTLAMFLHCFDWEVPKGVTIGLDEKFGLVTKKRVPLVAIPTPRLSNVVLYE